MNKITFNKVIVHPGVFHADDVVAASLVRVFASDPSNPAPIIRKIPSPEELADPLVAVLDVGRCYDPALGCFDHHQEKAGVYSSLLQRPCASAGLVWDWLISQSLVSQSLLRFSAMSRLVASVDAWDLGLRPAETPPVYTFSEVVNGFNDTNPADVVRQVDRFYEAVHFTETIIRDQSTSAAIAAEAEIAVLNAPVEDGVMILEPFAIWQVAILSRQDANIIHHVAFPSLRGGWTAQRFSTKKKYALNHGQLAGKPSTDVADFAGVKSDDPAWFCTEHHCGAPDKIGLLKLIKAFKSF